MASDPGSLPSPVGEAVATRGRSVLECHLDRAEPLANIVISSSSVRVVPRDRFYEPGDRIVVSEERGWEACEFVRPGDPDDAVTIEDERVGGGAYRRDVAWVCILSNDEIVARRYELLRPEVPTREAGAS
jgi:hypothetical protein